MAHGIIQKNLRRGKIANRLALALFAALTAVLIMSLFAGVSAIVAA